MRSNKAVKNKLHTKYALTEKLNYSIFIKKQKQNKSFWNVKKHIKLV